MANIWRWALAVFIMAVSLCRKVHGCVCWDNLNATMKADASARALPDDMPDYTYLGIKITTTGIVDACICTDVLRAQAVFTTDDEYVYNATKNSETLKIAENFTETLNSIIGEEMKNELVLAEVIFDSSEEFNDSTTKWILDVTLKGRASISSRRKRAVTPTRIEKIEILIKDKSTDNGDGTYKFANLIDVQNSDIKFTALTCKGSPPVAPGSGTRVWNTAQNYPGAKATYKCNSGFFLASGNSEDISSCLHANLTWSNDATKITCKKGCNGDPPRAPFYVSRKWIPTMRNDGDVAKYVCNNGYKSKVPATFPNATSVCKGSAWTPLDPTFECEQILCPEEKPQVPSFAINSTYDVIWKPGAKVTYSCMENYKSPKTGDVQITCLPNGVWEDLPKDFKCVNKAYAPVDDAFRGYDFYSDSGITQEKQTDQNYFLVYTVPSMIGLIILIFCCLCCCRIDSPIFFVCTKSAKKTRYDLDKKIIL